MRHAGLSAAPWIWRGALAGPLLLAILVSPVVAELSHEDLVAHHFAHWLMVGAGALAGYQLWRRVELPAPAPVAWAGLGAALLWHLPPALAWTETGAESHALAHASLLAGGAALGWAVPALGGGGRAALLIAASALMWPLALAELGGGFSYAGYPGQESAAGVAELVAMPLAWLALGLWRPLYAAASRPALALTLQGTLGALAVLGWTAG